MTMRDVLYRVLQAFDVMHYNIWPERITPELEADVAFLREQYASRRWKMGFKEAAYQAKLDLLERALVAPTPGDATNAPALGQGATDGTG
jgi:hypothetical protein